MMCRHGSCSASCCARRISHRLRRLFRECRSSAGALSGVKPMRLPAALPGISCPASINGTNVGSAQSPTPIWRGCRRERRASGEASTGTGTFSPTCRRTAGGRIGRAFYGSSHAPRGMIPSCVVPNSDAWAMLKLPRTIRLDPSDTFVFERAAEPGEWAVSGAFVFWNRDLAALSQKQRVALRSGFLGIDSLGWSTLAVVTEATEADRQAMVERLAGQVVE